MNQEQSTQETSHQVGSNPQIEALLARIKELETKAHPSQGGMKVSAKGALSVYGLGRFPVTLYASQWIKLLDKGDEVRKFIQNNTETLAQKEK